MKIAISAAETSGDIIASALVKSLLEYQPDCQIEGLAGDKMSDEGCQRLWHIDQVNVMGLSEVVNKLPSLLRLRNSIVKYFSENKPDVFIGVARGDLVTQEMVKSMSEKPIIFALSNPDPEISPVDAFSCRNDLLMATGRSDYPNQVNNVLGFPYIFRGALDANSKEINTEMKIAAVHALKDLAKLPVPNSVLQAYQIDSLSYGRDYIIPKPFDPRLIDIVPKAIFEAAVSSGVSCLT